MSPLPLQVEVRDHALWVRHIQGDAAVHLEVDGVAGDWRKMADGSDGSDGRPRLKPVKEPARGRRHALQTQRGGTVASLIIWWSRWIVWLVSASLRYQRSTPWLEFANLPSG